MNCLYCNQLLETDNPRAKYCSETHSKAYRRNTKSGHNPDKNDPDIATRTFDFKLTRTDRLFEDSKPNYYKFTKLKDETCNHCGKQFKTRLSLLRQCSPKCMNGELGVK